MEGLSYDDNGRKQCEVCGGYPAISVVVGEHIIVASESENGPELLVVEIGRALQRFKEAKRDFSEDANEEGGPEMDLYDWIIEHDVLEGDSYHA